MNLTILLASLFCALLGLVLGLYLMYLILLHVHASDVMWLVFTLYIPFTIIGLILSKVIDWTGEK